MRILFLKLTLPAFLTDEARWSGSSLKFWNTVPWACEIISCGHEDALAREY